MHVSFETYDLFRSGRSRLFIERKDETCDLLVRTGRWKLISFETNFCSLDVCEDTRVDTIQEKMKEN